MYMASPVASALLNEEDIAALCIDLQSLDYEQSTAKLTPLAAQYPNDARLPLLLAGAHAQAGQMDLAEAAFLSALQCDADCAIARFQLGLLQFTSARPAVASVTWAPLAELPPDDPLRLLTTGLEYLAKNNFPEAIHALELGIAKNTDNVPLNHDMQKILRAVKELRLLNQGAVHAPMPEPLAKQLSGQAATVVEEASEHFLVSAYRKLH